MRNFAHKVLPLSNPLDQLGQEWIQIIFLSPFPGKLFEITLEILTSLTRVMMKGCGGQIIWTGSFYFLHPRGTLSPKLCPSSKETM